jgi:hypothetical protein
MRWLAEWFMLVGAVSKGHEKGRRAEMEKIVEEEAVAGLQTETVGAQASTRLGPISTIAAALRLLVHPRTSEATAAEASAETERTSRPERDRSSYRSPVEAGITGGFSLLMDNPGARKRR